MASAKRPMFEYRVVGDGSFEFYVNDDCRLRGIEPLTAVKAIPAVLRAVVSEAWDRIFGRPQLSYRAVNSYTTEWYIDGRFLLTTRAHCHRRMRDLETALLPLCGGNWWTAEMVWQGRRQLH
jgi:hypothetical protein